MKLRDFTLTRARLVQFGWYMIGGMTYFWAGYLVFAICYSGFGWDWVVAKIFADLIGWTLNYLIQRYVAFNNKGLQHHEKQVVGRYGAITMLNFALDYLILWGLKSIGVSPYIGFFISSGFFTIWNYLWYRFWVFFGNRNK